MRNSSATASHASVSNDRNPPRVAHVGSESALDNNVDVDDDADVDPIENVPFMGEYIVSNDLAERDNEGGVRSVGITHDCEMVGVGVGLTEILC